MLERELLAEVDLLLHVRVDDDVFLVSEVVLDCQLVVLVDRVGGLLFCLLLGPLHVGILLDYQTHIANFVVDPLDFKSLLHPLLSCTFHMRVVSLLIPNNVLVADPTVL